MKTTIGLLFIALTLPISGAEPRVEFTASSDVVACYDFVEVTLNVEDQSVYYGRAVFGSSDWLDSEMGIEDYAHRGVPNTILTACLGSRGIFNAAHFKSAEYDRLVAGYIAALDPAAQRSSAGRIQRLLLEETPVITAYYYDWLSVTGKRVSGVRPSANGQLDLSATRLLER